MSTPTHNWKHPQTAESNNVIRGEDEVKNEKQFQKSNKKKCTQTKSLPLTHICITTQFTGLAQVLP